jgi:hypothetical protein
MFTDSSSAAQHDNSPKVQPGALGGDMAFRREMPTEADLLERELRRRVVRRIDDGRLPVALLKRIDGPYGTRRVCRVCDQPITCDSVDYDVVDFRKTTHLSLSFHSACHGIWQQECAHRVAAAKRTKQRDDPRIPQVTTSVEIHGRAD